MDKDHIRKDSASAQLNIIRLVLYISTILNFRLGTADIRGAYLRSGPIQRTIFLRPPTEWIGASSYQRGILWRLTKLPYGIVEAGRQWQKTVEAWMLQEYVLEIVHAISHVFAQRDNNGGILVIIAKLTDEFLCGGHEREIKAFMEVLSTNFTVGKVVLNDKFNFNGCEVYQDKTDNIVLTMKRYTYRIKPIQISRERNKRRTELVSQNEIH